MKEKLLKKSIQTATLIAGIAIFLCGCKHDMDNYEKKPYTVTDAERVAYAERTLGITIDPQQDWVLTSFYSVKIVADADLENISEVVVLDGNPFLKTTQMLAHKSLNKGDVVTLLFRAESVTNMLYAACITRDGHCIARPFIPGQDSEVSFIDKIPTEQASARTRTSGIVIPESDFSLFYKKDFPSFRDAVLKLLPDGKDNRSVLGDVDYTDTIQIRKNPYFITDVPLAFMCGKGESSDNICYTWYPGGELPNKETFLMKDDFTESKDAPTYDSYRREWALKGFYLHCRQSDETTDRLFSTGDVLAFQLARNEEVMPTITSPRVKVFMFNGYVFLACEDGNDWDYRDRMFWMPQGAERIEKAKVIPVDPEPIVPQVWTYAWEDKDFGDYDMNDCVIEVQENANDNKKLDITLVALGGARSLWLGFENKNAKSYKDYQPVFQDELHKVLGVPVGTLVNTGRASANPVTITVDRPADFDYQTNSFVLGCMLKEDQQGIYDNDYYYIPIATKGQDPHGIVIPGKWQWPTEQTCITSAYPKFAIWANDITKTDAKDWYKHPVSGKVVKR